MHEEAYPYSNVEECAIVFIDCYYKEGVRQIYADQYSTAVLSSMCMWDGDLSCDRPCTLLLLLSKSMHFLRKLVGILAGN